VCAVIRLSVVNPLLGWYGHPNPARGGLQSAASGEFPYFLTNAWTVVHAEQGWLFPHHFVKLNTQVLGQVTMRRDDYRLFSEGRIGPVVLSNRLVRSATWDPAILQDRRMRDDVLDVYRRLAAGGVGLIITGDSSVVPDGLLDQDPPRRESFSYNHIRIEGYDRLAGTVHATRPGCKIFAQLSADYPGVGPSDVASPFEPGRPRPLTTEQVQVMVHCLAESIAGIQGEGFDGVQLHAAHGGLLGHFLSPYTNRRGDEYGGSVANRARPIREIVAGAREKVGDFPILIKLNGTDYLPGGIDLDTFPELAREIAAAGVDAIEVSGGMWDCLIRPGEELGFRPVPAPESHTRLKSPDRQSYFARYAERLDVDIPLILVGGNRDAERLEAILRRGVVDFVALCRPLIHEPGLPNRWLAGQGSSSTGCISCNSCLYDMYTSLERGEPGVVPCLFNADRRRVGEAQRWLSSWVQENRVS
jgi:2,4-dienoyl-CoA reductase-like NADH-dependent reductase (Old Yellow Enzyme family)